MIFTAETDPATANMQLAAILLGLVATACQSLTGFAKFRGSFINVYFCNKLGGYDNRL